MDDKHLVVAVIDSYADIKKIKSNTVYININLDKVDTEVIEYFIKNGQSYYYAESINRYNGYNYVDYDTFKEANSLLNQIINKMPNNLSKLAIIRYFYITICQLITYDINTIYDKNVISFYSYLSNVNSLWGCLKKRKGTNLSYAKLFCYLCNQFGIENEIIALNDKNYVGNKITICDGDDKYTIITDITKDVPFVQAGFKTTSFGNYNDDNLMDKQIGYIKKNYSDNIIYEQIKLLPSKHQLTDILSLTQKNIDIYHMGCIELGIIHDIILKKYCPIEQIKIHNLYVNNNEDRKHFLIFASSEKYYSYNYRLKKFVSIDSEEIQENIRQNKIKLYDNEEKLEFNNELKCRA